MITPQYLAGLIDGEGYLALIPARVVGLKQESFEPVVKIGMTGSGAMQIATELVAMYGGHLEKRNGFTKGGRQAYTYNAKSKKRVGAILDDILPHLIIKREQAQLLKEFCSLGSSHSRYSAYSAEVVARKAVIYHKLKQLKQPEPLAETK